jgi:HD-GYP domain-containing protein (c-di-GMP phosphodiesterase class II)
MQILDGLPSLLPNPAGCAHPSSGTSPTDAQTSELCYDLSNPHIIRMALYSIEIARRYGIDDPFALDDVYFTAILHDIGKTALRPEVLNKPGPLTPEERAHVETHAAIGGDMVGKMPGWERISRAVRAHHERWDGAGYPDRLAGEAIPLPARIVAVADVFDALTSHRPYRTPLTVPQALRHVRENGGTHFDPGVVAAFRKVSAVEWRRLHAQADGLTSASLLQVHNW